MPTSYLFLPICLLQYVGSKGYFFYLSLSSGTVSTLSLSLSLSLTEGDQFFSFTVFVDSISKVAWIMKNDFLKLKMEDGRLRNKFLNFEAS